MKTISLIFTILLFFSLDSQAKSKKLLKVSYPKYVEFNYSIASYKEILNCALGSKYQLEYTSLPAIRQQLTSQKYDIVFPLQEGNVHFHLSEPFFLNEIVMINSLEKKKEVNDLIGVVSGSVADEYGSRKKLNTSYRSNHFIGLYRAFDHGRIDRLLTSYKNYDYIKNRKYNSRVIHYDISGLGVSKRRFSENEFTKMDISLKKCLTQFEVKVNESFKATIFDIIQPQLVSLISEIKINNKVNFDLKKIDNIWQSNHKLDRFEQEKYFKKVMQGKYANLLKSTQLKAAYIEEAFIMNHQGGLLGSIYKTDDFDQSDEYKFKVLKKLSRELSIQNLGDLSYDYSRNKFLLSIYIPIYDQFNFSGGIYMGIDLNKLIENVDPLSQSALNAYLYQLYLYKVSSNGSL